MKKKNVLILYTDQAQKDVFSCYGGKEISTTHIDSLAQEGARCDNFFTPSAVCTPSRGCFQTGLYPFKHGAFRNGVPVHSEARGFANVFAEQGYETGYVGKWHLGDNIELGGSLDECNKLGYKTWYNEREIAHAKSISADGLHYTEKIESDSIYTTDWIASKTEGFLKKRSHDQQPFLFMASFPDPHQPFTVRAPYDTMFDPKTLSVPESFDEKKLPDWAEYDTWGRQHYFPLGLFDRRDSFLRMKAQYLGALKCLDDAIGGIIKTLKETGLWQDTIVVFTSDHGEYLGRHGLMEKNNLYHHVYSVPFIITAPGTIKPKTVVRDWINVVDFPATLFSLACLPDGGLDTDGEDCAAYFSSHQDVYTKPIQIYPSDVPRVGVITPKYQLAYVGQGWQTEREFTDHILFDLEADPEQLNNLFTKPEYQGVVKELTDWIVAHHRLFKTPKDYIPSVLRDQFEFD